MEKISQKGTYRVQPTFIYLLALTFDVNLIPYKVIPAAVHTKLADLPSFLKVICIYIKCSTVEQTRTRMEIQVKKLYGKPY